MNQPKWVVIARNEYRLMTSGSLLLRRYLPFIVIVLTFLFIFVLAPAIFDLVRSDFIVLMLSNAALSFWAILLLTFFFYFMIIPITNTLKEEQTSELEIFLAAPVKPEQVLLGKFMGKFVLYGTGSAIIAGILAGAFTLLEISAIQMLIIVVTVLLTLITGLWFGTVIAAVLRTRLSKTARGTDIGKALSLIIILPLLGFVYALISGAIFGALENPSTVDLVETLLGIFPTTWVADILVAFGQNPGLLFPSGSLTALAILGIVLFSVGSFFIGNRAVARAYSLEPTSFSSFRARKEGIAIRSIRKLTGSGQFSVVVVTMFKDWGRRLENISKVGYILGLVFLLAIFFSRPEDPFGVVILLQFMVGFLAAFVVGEVTIRGKEILFIYRKAPYGEKRLVWGRLVQAWLIVAPISFLVTLISLAFIPDLPVTDLLIYPLFMVQLGMAVTAFVLGLFLVQPAFSEKSGEMIINMMGTLFIFFILIILSITYFGILGLVILFIPLSWILAICLLFFGLKKLSQIE